jgi:sulfur relay protein TusB/DsrH
LKVLHIIRNSDDPLARRMIDQLADGAEQTLLLIQDGVYMRPQGAGEQRVLACADDVRARGVETDAELVEYGRIVDMVFEYDKVITW